VPTMHYVCPLIIPTILDNFTSLPFVKNCHTFGDSLIKLCQTNFTPPSKETIFYTAGFYAKNEIMEIKRSTNDVARLTSLTRAQPVQN